ncbi:MAG: TIGR03435 family protein [Terriglobia bacterium]
MSTPHRLPLRLDPRREALLAIGACLAIAMPIGFGLANGRTGQENGSKNTAATQPGNALASTARFEAASIRQINLSGNRHLVMRIIDRPDDGRFYATAVTSKVLIQIAYGVQDSQIEGGPKWINSERFDVQAKSDDALSDDLKELSPDQAKLVKQRMLQALLADRFELTVLRKTKELPVYDLVVAKNGPKLQEASKAGTSSAGGRMASNGPMAHSPPAEGERRFTSNTTMPFLAVILSHMVGRIVVDKTGLIGRYNLTVHWTPELGRGGPGGGPGRAGAAEESGLSVPDSSGPSLFTALQQQLGLRLKPAKGPVQVLVIDHIERPTPN